MSLSVYLFQSFFCYLILTNHLRAENVTTQIKIFSSQLESLMCDGLAVGGDKCDNVYGIQDFIYSFQDHFQNVEEDASPLAKTIIARLNKKLNLRASFLKNMSSIIRSECYQHAGDSDGDESITEFNDLYFAGNTDRAAFLPSNMEYNTVYENTISLSASTYKLPNGVDWTADNIQQDAQISELLDDIMIDLYNRYCIDEDGIHEYCSSYFGTINGVFRNFPGVENTKSGDVYANYDPRFRPWYVSAASGSKDVVILLDVSGSMKNNQRIQLAKKAVISVLNTLGSSSFVNVVAFSDIIQLTCFEKNLVAATSRNIAKLVDFVQTLQPGRMTNFTIAFNAAFDILSQGTSCETSILFLTDGIAAGVSDLISERNTVDIGAVIFSFTLGGEASAGVPKKVAALTDGLYTHIDDKDENLITAMSSYYLYYAYGGSASEDESIIITSPYLDFDTSIVMVTMAMPVYFNSTYFVGVVGTDIPLRFLSDAIGDVTIGRKSYSFVMNEESELLLHPLIPDAFQLFDSNTDYKAIFVQDVEPEEFDSSGTLQSMLQGGSGVATISATVKQPAGNVVYNGFIYENANLLYIYGPVGPSSLSIGIVIYSEQNVEAPMVPAFGMKSSPNTDCNDTINDIESELYECLAPFNLFHRLDLMLQCNSSWLSEAQILNGSDAANSALPFNAFYEGQLYSAAYPIYFVQSGLFERQYDALNIDPSCEALQELHDLSNRIGSSINVNNLPYGGFREEVDSSLLNSIYTLTSLHEFWKPAFLANDSLFVSMWFGHYQGIHVSYPGKKFSSSYNNQIRPWYQRAISYPNRFVWTTPYKHATTLKLVTGASTVVYAPSSDYAYGVLGFNYEYAPFVAYWKSVMDSVCEVCFLVDSSAFLLYYDGMDGDVDDDDIGHKFLGDIQPTIMQSLLDRGFFVNDTNVNFEDDTVDVTYIVDENAYSKGNFESQPTGFARNHGFYTVHAVSKTNLYVIYIESYQLESIYPKDCPNDDDCLDVISPGCIKTTAGACQSATIDVCISPDTTVSADVTGSVQCSVISELGICALQSDSTSDMCASNFLEIDAGCKQVAKGDGVDVVLIVGCVIGGVALIVIIVIIWYCAAKNKRTQPNEGSNVQMQRMDHYSNPNPPPETNPAYYY